MKCLLFLLAALVCWAGAGAQDVILLRNADEVKAVVQEITDSHLLYKEWGGSEQVFSVPRSEIFSVTYQNGERELFMDDRAAAGAASVAADYPWPKVTKSYRPGDLFDEDGLRGLVISTTDDGRHGLILSLDFQRLSWGRNISGGNQTLEVTIGATDVHDGWNNQRRFVALFTQAGLDAGEFPAFEWCVAKGGGWYLPAVNELKGLWELLQLDLAKSKLTFSDFNRSRKLFKEFITRCGGGAPGLLYLPLWSSTEYSATEAYLCGGMDFHSGNLASGSEKYVATSVRAVHKF